MTTASTTSKTINGMLDKVRGARRQPMTEEALLAAVALGPAGYAGDVVFESPARLRELGARLGGVERVTLQGWADQRETEEYDHAHRPGL